MLYSKRNRFLYLEVPQTGPRAVNRLLAKQLGAVRVNRPPAKLPEGTIVFAVICDPYDRLQALFKDPFSVACGFDQDWPEFVRRCVTTHWPVKSRGRRRRVKTLYAPQATTLRRAGLDGVRIIKAENLGRGLRRLPFVKAAMSPPGDVKPGPRDAYADPEIRRLARTWAAPDCREFGYSLEP